jgi:signal transduction histidine kinase
MIQLSMDVHLIKDSTGKVIGREGTIRDVTGEMALKKKINATKKSLEKTTADIDRIIHQVLQPIISFSGDSDQLQHVGNLLEKTAHPGDIPILEGKDLGEKLLDKKIEKEGSYYKKNEKDLLKISKLKEKLSIIINDFDYKLQIEKSKTLLDSSTADTALRVLNELNEIKFSEYSELTFLFQEGFIKFLHKILLRYSVHIAEILKRETEMMKRGVETLRSYIGLREKMNLKLVKSNLEEILVENIERFRPIFLKKEVRIEHNISGNLEAELAPNDMNRAIYNLFKNAGDYSLPGPRRFVKIRAREIQPGDQVEFSIENFGIAIKKEEIASGYIFEPGNRGEFALKNDSDGNGYGLTDAMDTVKAHGGELIVTSIPVTNDGNPPEYKVPYKTTITVRLPKKAK